MLSACEQQVCLTTQLWKPDFSALKFRPAFVVHFCKLQTSVVSLSSYCLLRCGQNFLQFKSLRFSFQLEIAVTNFSFRIHFLLRTNRARKGLFKNYVTFGRVDYAHVTKNQYLYATALEGGGGFGQFRGYAHVY